MNELIEIHSEEWMKRHIAYLYDCQKHSNGPAGLMNSDNDYDIAEGFQLLPCARWFLAAYTRDVNRQLASITSTFGEVLKIDSTKKILRKLAGENRNSANWQTNVGNEYGAILQSVLTSSESNDALPSMANGIVACYATANVSPPTLLYTD
ncbi:uncharacterized protein LOC130623457 [Hydractinia symbiolongicarpus]|uniref:uncharacterized protein LOC130623457 n=1 Tax=Hydractinia symbiolongicarpus TaxID=13093 RepID=UPI00254CCC63|nr:uncharacterized protein LOC130623457 [Hydractinia symbiolongicarpus]XP_057294928.1 uncharacterized protein LOC130623457 [Hydractinia symbiolongicarpus]